MAGIQKMNNYWVSFWVHEKDLSAFEYHGPWWESGWDLQDRRSFCAAVLASSEEEAKKVINNSFDNGHSLDEWRFVNYRPEEWSPFNDRFQKVDWMKWPYPVNN